MKWRTLNLAAPEFEQRSEPPAVCGVIYTGKRHLASGLPEAAKTLFALIVGLELRRSAAGTFALIDFESGPEATRLMLTDLGASIEEIGSVHYVDADGPPDNDDMQALLVHDVQLAIIDAAAGAYDVSALDDNKRQDTERFGRTWIDPLWQAGVTTLLLDHVVKNTDSRGKFAIGSERKAGRTDVHLGIEAVTQLTRGKTGLIRIATHKDRPGWLTRPHAAELELVSDPATHAITWTFRPTDTDSADDWRPTALMEKVSRYLETQIEPVSRNTIEQNVTGKGKYVRQAIDVLCADGFARETSGNRGSRRLTSSRPFRVHLVPTSSHDTQAHLVPTSSPTNPHEHSDSATSSHLVPPRPDNGTNYLVPSSLPYKGDEDGDEVNRDDHEEQQRLAYLYATVPDDPDADIDLNP